MRTKRGGSLEQPTLYSIIVSHNSRIQCLLAKLGHQPEEPIRFQNGCVLKITVSTSIEVSLLHTGNITEKDKTNSRRFYYSPDDSPKDPQKYVPFKSLEIPMDRTKFGLTNAQSNTAYVFYVVRHGESEHNQIGWKHLTLDTHLIESGKLGAAKAGGSIIMDLSRLNAKLSAYFVSDLVRTRETLNAMKKSLYMYSVTNCPTVVLPCSSEVAKVGKNGECDATGYLWNKMARENYPSCTLQRIKSTDPTEECNKLNWDLYLKFYGGNMRGENESRMRCRDTNMLAMAIYWLSFKTMDLDNFGKFIKPNQTIQSNVYEASGNAIPRETVQPIDYPRAENPLPREIMQPNESNRKSPPSPMGPAPKHKNANLGWLWGSYGGTKRRKLKRTRTRRRG